MGDNPADNEGFDNPVENVSWNDCQEFLKKLNAMPAIKETGLVFRLPTEEEWEYACRAGSSGDFCRLANGTEITEETVGLIAWCQLNANGKTHPVGQRRPNAFGLYDIYGNVGEWCQDERIKGAERRRISCGTSFDTGMAWWSFRYRADLPDDARLDCLGLRLFADVAKRISSN